MPTPTPGPDGGCNGRADFTQFPTTGCTSGFTNLGTYCGLSEETQAFCLEPSGYDEFSCSCPDGVDTGGGGGGGEQCASPPQTFRCDFEIPQTSCDYFVDNSYCQTSPILIDVLGNGFSLTDAAAGTQFDVANHGSPQQIAWTSGGADDAWLVLDRNGNGIIDDGKELFGNSTAQPSPPSGEERNGFLALAVFDRISRGGNADGIISQLDRVFPDLRLWQDTNHNGLSESYELFTLPQLGLRKIDLKYKRSRRIDVFGNEFRYRAKVKDAQDAQLGRWAWDVFLVTSP
jgi:hypothetical protein